MTVKFGRSATRLGRGVLNMKVRLSSVRKKCIELKNRAKQLRWIDLCIWAYSNKLAHYLKVQRF